MITEDYVSFGTAKLLKEKGFDEECKNAYFLNGALVDYTMFGFCLGADLIPCPTLQMAMRWLRKVHNLHVDVHYNAFWDYYQYIILYRGEKIKSDMAYPSFEGATEAVIKFCLKKLI